MAKRNDIERLFKEYYRRLLGMAVAMLHDGDSARDAVHDVFAGLLNATGEDRELSVGYLMAGVRNRCLNIIRARDLRQRAAELFLTDPEVYDSEEWPDEETLSQIHEIISSDLTPQGKRVMDLRFSEGLPFREIAEEMEVSENAVYKHLRRALNVIRTKLKDNG